MAQEVTHEIVYENAQGEVRTARVFGEQELCYLMTILKRNNAQYIVKDLRSGYVSIPVQGLE